MENKELPLMPEADAVPEALTAELLYKDKIFEATYLRDPQWLQDSKRFSFLDHAPDSKISTVWLYNIETGEKAPLIALDTLKFSESERAKNAVVPAAEGGEPLTGENPADYYAIPGYQWSPDETQLLLTTAPKHRSFGKGDTALYVYTIATKSIDRVTKEDANHLNAKWSPDKRRIAYVKNDDLYVADSKGEHEIRLTDTAAKTVYNGRFGWVYEEELDLVDGWAWSPDGKRIAYYQIDETPVPQINLPNYDDLHMKPIETRYPKAGDPNPLVRIGILDVPDDPKAPVPATRWADIGADNDIYIARMQWTPSGKILLQRIPRLQNKIELLLADPATGKSQVILTEEDKAWVEAPGDLKFMGDQFLWPSERSGNKHFYLYDLKGKLIRQVSAGDWEADKLAGVDETHRIAYFTAARPNPRERHLFSVLIDGGSAITQLTEAPGTHAALFSPDGSHYLGTYSGRDTPPKITLHRASGHAVALVHENAMPRFAALRDSTWEYQTFKTADGTSLNTAILKPPHFDPKKKYPVLMYTYGGPGSQVVRDTFGSGSGLERMLAQKGYVFAMVDGRGSGGRGRDFEKVTYLNLGHYEVNDQIEGAKWLAAMPFVDPKRIGIWGWSYGGYMASLCILRGADVFKTAVAVAPVTHWNLYDSIYTERYMRRPHDNEKGYTVSSPLEYVEQLKGNFLLVHGTADDNVHFQNSARLAEAFEKHNKQFRTMYYPGKHHGLEGVSLHLFTMITDFIEKNL